MFLNFSLEPRLLYVTVFGSWYGYRRLRGYLVRRVRP